MAKPSISKNAVLNVLRSVLSLAFPLITYPYAARILRLQAIGRYDYAESIIGILSLVAMLGIQLYAIREGTRYKDDPEKMNRFASEVFSINLYATAATFVILLCLTLFVSKLTPYSTVLWLLSIRILLTTLGVNWICTIFEDFSFLTLITVILEVLSIILLFVFVRDAQDLNQYILITNIAVNGSGLFMFLYSRRYVRLRFIPVPPLRHLRPVLLIFSMEIGTVIFVRSDVALLGWFTNDEVTGLYGMAAQIYRIVKAVLYAVIAVVIPRFSYYIRRSESGETPPGEKAGFRHSAEELGAYLIGSMFTLCLPVMTGLMLMSRPIVLVFAGADFAGSAVPLAMLSVALLFAMFENFYAQCVLITFREERFLTFATFLSAAVNVVLNLILIPRFMDRAAALTTIIAEALMLFLCFAYSRRHIRFHTVRKVLLTSLSGCAVIAGICLTALLVFSDSRLILLTAVPLSAIVYFLMQIRMRNPVIRDMIRDLPILRSLKIRSQQDSTAVK